MSTIEWLSSFETGHEEIDRQHRELVDEIAALHDDLVAGKFVTANDRCRAARARMQRHFEYEELVLINLDFQQFNRHVKTHAAARQDVQGIISECCENCSLGLGLKCTRRWSDSILTQVLQADLKIKSELRERGNVPRRPW